MLRRNCLVALLFAAAAPAMAQTGQGTIFYASGGPQYRVGGDGAGQALYTSNKAIPGAPSARSDYPGGRISPTIVSFGNIPGTDPSRNFTYGNIWAQFEDGSIKRLVRFANPETGPLYVITFFTQNLWSNDGQDRFFSFLAYDNATGLYHVLRANVTGDQIAAPDFQPLVQGDPRLEVIATWATYQYCGWDPGGTTLFYIEGKRIRAHAVGTDPAGTGDPVVYDNTALGNWLANLDVSPAGDRLVFEAEGGGSKSAGTGLMVVNPGTGAAAWLLKDVATGVYETNNPRFSPDGTGVAFGARRYVKKTAGVPGVYKIPTYVAGGAPIRLTEAPADGNGKVPRGWRW